MSKPEIRVTGLRELGAAFRSMEGGFQKELQQGFKAIAGTIVDDIRGRVRWSTVRPRASQRGAALAFPVGTYRRRSGGFIYPTILARRDELEEAAGDVMLNVARRAGFTTHG